MNPDIRLVIHVVSSQAHTAGDWHSPLLTPQLETQDPPQLVGHFLYLLYIYCALNTTLS